jgi:hypothetical protein
MGSEFIQKGPCVVHVRLPSTRHYAGPRCNPNPKPKLTLTRNGVSHIFTIDFTVTFTFSHTGWGSYVTNFGLLAGDVT